MTLTNCTSSGNSATSGSGGGIGQSWYGTVTLGNTIVAGNTATASGPDVFGAMVSQGYNLIGETDGSTGSVAFDLTDTVASPLDPHLGPLANNGGPTMTMALLPGSVNSNDPLVPVAGGQVTFTGPLTGAGLTAGTFVATIAANGQASLTAVANASAGAYTVTAAANGATGTAAFQLTNTPTKVSSTTTTTQDALNMAKQGKLTITISNVAGLVNGDKLALALTGAEFYLTIGANRYVFVPTSAATAVSAGFLMESQNYTLTDDYLTRLFSTAK